MVDISRRTALAFLCVAQFLVVANITLVAIALPAMRRELGISAAGVHWVITTYTLVFGGTLLLSGRLAGLRGHRGVLTAGLAVFAAGSLGCGLASHQALLLAARGVQGLGAAAIAASTLVILVDTYPAGRGRDRALAVWSAAQALGGATGWLLGGLVSQLAGWHWVFLANVPPAVLGAVLAPFVLPRGERRASGRLDARGAALVMVGLFLVIYGLTELAHGGTASGIALLAVPAGCLTLAGFAAHARRAADPIVPPAVLRDRPLVTGTLVVGLANALVTPVLLLCARYLQDVAGMGAAVSGLLFVPFNLAVIAGSVLAARRGVRNRHRVMALAIGGIAVAATLLTTGTSLAHLLPAFVALGAGGGAAVVAANAMGTASVDHTGRGVASGLLTTATELGVAIGTATLVTIAALTAGSRLAFAVTAVLGALAALLLARAGSARSAHQLPVGRARDREQ